jgi:hypothetical protein
MIMADLRQVSLRQADLSQVSLSFFQDLTFS